MSMTDDERRKHWRAREKLHEAVRCLISNKSLRDRLVDASYYLSGSQIHHDEVNRLPEDVRSTFAAVVHDLTKHQPDPLRADDSGYKASVEKLTPRQRAKIAEDILNMFVALGGDFWP